MAISDSLKLSPLRHSAIIGMAMAAAIKVQIRQAVAATNVTPRRGKSLSVLASDL